MKTRYKSCPAFRVIFPLLVIATAAAGTCCRGQGLTPAESVRQMTVPAGFQVSVAAAEPLVRQPVAIDFDNRGRLWVIQYLQYPNPAGLKRVRVDRYSRTQYDRVPQPPPLGPRGADRISILEDTDGDGRMDHSHDFVSGLNLATGFAFGHGGVFVLNVPYLLFYPDRDGDDVPDSDPEVLLTGFGMEDAHSVANSLTWGPDGWLYGCQGSTVTANIRGIEFQQGVWRFHPVTHKFELFCEGGGNSWGLDFGRTGNLFYSTNYGNYVLLHGVQGGYFVKSFAKHGDLHNSFAYGYFNHAPHKNFRGGHVTVGGIVYQGDAFPERFRGQYIAGDLLGHGVYWHSIEPWGSTFRTAHGGQLLESADPWFAPTDVTLGPDGAVYVSDWHDARTAHPDPDAEWDRSNGRILRITATGSPTAPGSDQRSSVDIATMTTDQLLQLHTHRSQWYVRRARMELAQRSRMPEETSPDLFRARQNLRQTAATATDEGAALEALWTLSVVGGFDEGVAADLLDSPHAAVRAWTVRLLGDHGSLSEQMAGRLDDLAEQEPDVRTRQQLASTARRLPAHQAVPIINTNINRDIDNDDPYLPLLWWWAVEQHSVDGRAEVVRRFVRPSLWQSQLGRDFLLPKLLRRYSAEATTAGLDAILQLVTAAPDDEARQPLWSAVLAGWNEHPADISETKFVDVIGGHSLSQTIVSGWQLNTTDLVLTELAVRLRNPSALAAATREAFDAAADQQRRIALLKMLTDRNDAITPESILSLVKSGQPVAVRQSAMGMLASSGESQVTDELMKLLSTATMAELHPRIRDILLARFSGANVLLRAVDRGELPASSIPLGQIRRVAMLDDKRLNQIVAKHWGQLRSATPEEKLAEVRRLNNDLRAGEGDAESGRTLFRKHCAACHRLFGEGRDLGPDLTSANRQDRNFLLISLVDPDSVIRKEYVSVIIQTNDGRVLTGLPVRRDGSAIEVADASRPAPVAVRLSEIAELHPSPVSLMPANLYREFSPQQLRDLFRYLQSERKPQGR